MKWFVMLRAQKIVIFLTFCNGIIILMNTFCIMEKEKVSRKSVEIQEVVRYEPCPEKVKKMEQHNKKTNVARVRVTYKEEDSSGSKSDEMDAGATEFPLCASVAGWYFGKCEIPFANFSYPLNIDLNELVTDYKNKKKIQEKVINFHNFTELLKPRRGCRNKNIYEKFPTYMLILVKSAPKHYERRNIIRQTWANEDRFPSVRHVFLVGIPLRESTREGIKAESSENGDILQLDFIDTYYNNTLKAIGGINWASKNCQRAQWVTMVDDDYYLATDVLLRYLRTLEMVQKTKVYMGGVIPSSRPGRGKDGKWYISIAEYPFDKYPPVIRAGTIVMSIDVIQDISIAIPYTKLFKFDDVYIAIIAYKLGIKPLADDRFYFRKVRHTDDAFITAFSSHGYKSVFELKHTWRCHLLMEQMGENATTQTCM